MALRKILVANRGEIAVRIIRAARELGIATVQAVSAADRSMLAAQLADEVAEVGPAHAAKSYLNQSAILDAARRSGADAVHPGYGFLSENPEFAAAVEDAGLVFVGPRAATVRDMGDKAQARQLAAAAGVPTVPGTAGCVEDPGAIQDAAARIGFPVMIKAAAGGGGRGLRVAHDADQLAALVPQARAEAKAAFGDDAVYLEHFIAKARHVEVQVLGDGERVVHLFERECSVQRRRQKLWEEAPAACLTPMLRDALCEAAVRLARHIGYRGAGTMEFLLDDASGAFFFIEMNTRIQVEHPVTEMVTGVDLVREMIRIAGGESLRWSQADIRLAGHAIECRINAEDAAHDFRPAPGEVTRLRVPGGPGVRFDSMLYPGYLVPPFYDSLLGKLIVWDEDRPAALRRMARALAELEVGGIATTIPLHRQLATDRDMAAQALHTRWLEHWLNEQAWAHSGKEARRA
ncbi:MAG: acetyl-CoA carboxylase biotin carboxylase subunit [Alphaproteobacteria bacterium]|nr:acetyl-CoA carboxylase biotin carboxylase subunit [Alphaproteobacteria bacterium]